MTENTPTSASEHTGPIDLAAMDAGFAAEITARPGGEHLLHCFACGTCTSTCPVAEAGGDYNPRLIIRKILLGQKDEVLGDPAIWYCRSCFRCSTHCPQDVRFSSILQILRNLAVEQEYVTAVFVEAAAILDRESERLRLRALEALAGSRTATVQPDPAELLKSVAAREEGK